MKDKLTHKEAALYLGITRQNIERLLRIGVVKAEDNPLDINYRLIDLFELDRVKVYGKYLIDNGK